MARRVKCVKLGRDGDGLDFPPFPGALGKRIWENVSKEAWAHPKARKYLMDQTERHFFGEGADTASGYVPPKA